MISVNLRINMRVKLDFKAYFISLLRIISLFGSKIVMSLIEAILDLTILISSLKTKVNQLE